MSYLREVYVVNTAGPGGVNISQSHLDVAASSSTANLNAGATFTGTSASSVGWGSIIVNLKSDRDCTIYIEQNEDGSNWDVSDTYAYYANIDNFSVLARVVMDNFRVRVTNISPSNTTYFRLVAELHPTGEVLPQTLDARGALKVGVKSLQDEFGFQGSFTPMNDLKVAEAYRLVGVPFGAANDANFWTLSNSGTGSATSVSGGIATLTSGTTNSGYGQIASVRLARFVFAHPHLFRALVRLPDATELNNTRRWGAFTVSTNTPQNGFYFSVGDTGALSVNAVTGGTPTTVTSGDFNGLLKEYVVDTNMHAYHIVYFQAAAHFYVDGVLIHTMLPTTAPLTGTLHLPITATSVNSGSGTESAVLELWAATILRLGRDLTNPTSYAFAAATTTGITLKTGPGVLHGVTIGDGQNNAVVTLYDSTAGSGTIIGSWRIPNSSIIPVNMTGLDMPFYTGLTLVVSTATAGCSIIYE